MNIFGFFTELTKQEIRTLEGKLIKHFSKQLATRATLSGQKVCDISAISQYPSLNQWLKVVGITKDSADILESRVNSLDALKDKTDSELNRLLLQVLFDVILKVGFPVVFNQ